MADVEPERALAHYRLGGLIARGATGAVYRGFELASGRAVAIKVLEHGLAPTGSAVRERRARLARYLERMRELQHPSVVAVLDAGCEGRCDYIVMELARGCDLTACLAPGHLLPLERTLKLAVEIAAALAHAHAQGVLHGDVKPANVVYDAPAGTVKLLDFALALSFDAETGSTPGTPLYLAPERLCGGAALPASDQFSLAVLLYRLVCGQLPFGGATRPEIVWNMVHGRPRPLADHHARAPRALGMVIQKALGKQPRARYADMGEMGCAIQAVLEQSSKRSTRRADASPAPCAAPAGVS